MSKSDYFEFVGPKIENVSGTVTFVFFRNNCETGVHFHNTYEYI